MAQDAAGIHEVLLRHRDALLGREGVVAVGIGFKVSAGRRTDQRCIACSVIEKKPQALLDEVDRVPPVLDGVRTDVVQTGRIRALMVRTERQRPSPGGVSIAHPGVTAGTLGCVVRRNGAPMILSNNHVLADSNDAEIGDPIYQPGPADGGTSADTIAHLEDFVPISFTGGDPDTECPVGSGIAGLLNALAALSGSRTRVRTVRIQEEANLVDAALARPISADAVEDRILEIGTPSGIAEGALGMEVQKSGRTTALTRGEIIQVDVTVEVNFGAGRVARFTDQLMAGPMSQGGDSGSAVLDSKRNVVGLLFAGSDSTTIINRIQNVNDLLGITP
ncbi:MAG: hypothetical protein RQ745_10090 [Longimicrobiales bacterium]|nr:hypothetical protein [Longimicrobiales bacterium]